MELTITVHRDDEEFDVIIDYTPPDLSFQEVADRTPNMPGKVVLVHSPKLIDHWEWWDIVDQSWDAYCEHLATAQALTE